jgi:dipeptidase E
MRVLLLSLGLGRMVDFIPPPAKIGFVGTAGETYEDPYFVRADRARLEKLGYELTDLDVTRSNRSKLQASLSDQDGIFIAGGNSFYLLQQFRLSGMDALVKEFVGRGGAYIGASAGAAVCGPSLEPVQVLDNPKDAPSLKAFDALDLVDVIVLPHYGKPKYLDLYHKIMDEYAERFHTVPLKDDQAIVMTDRSRYDIVPSELILHDSRD